MKKSIYIVAGFIIVFIVGLLIGSTNFWKANDVKNNVVQDLTVKEVTLSINNGDGSPKIVTTEFKEGMTAFDLLKVGAEKIPLEIKSKNYDIGVFIEAIGDKENGQDKKYWQYYVNGDLPMVAADKRVIRAGDSVEFRFETPPSF